MAHSILAVAGTVFDAFPGMRIVTVRARGLDNATARPAVTALWLRAWNDATGPHPFGSAQEHPRIAPWRAAWQRLGISVKKFPSSIEALLRRAMKGGEPFSISPLVDFYNAVSLTHVVPAGGYDLDELPDGLELRFTRPGDRFQALDEEEPADVPPGEVAYATGSTVLTRHLVWRQARQALIGAASRDVVLVSEILAALADDVATAVASDLVSGLEQHFGATCDVAVLSATRPILLA